MITIQFTQYELETLYDMVVSSPLVGNADLRRDITDKIFIGLFGKSDLCSSFVNDDLRCFVSYDC